MKVTFIIKKAAKRYDTESTATIYVRFRNGRQLDSVAPGKSSVSCPLKPSDSAPLKHSTMPP